MRGIALGGPVFLVVVGAILYFAVNYQVSGIEISTIGLILMVAGGIWLVISLLTGMMGRRTRTTEQRTDSYGNQTQVDRDSEIH